VSECPSDLSTKTPKITDAYGAALKQRKRAVRVTQGANTSIQITMRDECGEPVDLTSYGFVATDSSSSSGQQTGIIKVRFRESSIVNHEIYDVSGTVVDAAAGTVKCKIPQSQVMDVAGVWLANIGIFNASSQLIFANELFVYNEKSPWVLDSIQGPPSIDDIRLSLRDSDPQINELIENNDFDLAEISHAATRVVQFWNDQPPALAAAHYNSVNFPFREIWLKGIHVFLFQVAEEHYRRNRFPYNAGGTQIDDKSKAPDYNRAWNERFQEFRQMVMHRKVQINAGGAFNTLRSGY